MCLKTWNLEKCVPKSLPCGHSFCSNCLEDYINKTQTFILCPICKVKHKLDYSEVKGLSKNFSIISLLNDESKPLKKFVQPVCSKRKSSAILDVKPHFNLDYIEKSVTLHPYCTKHKMLIHSYASEIKKILCDQCIHELPESVVIIKPIPIVFYILNHRFAKH